MEAKKCQLCGTNSGIYPLCKTHLKMKENGEVFKNEETGKWDFKIKTFDFSSKKNNNIIEKKEDKKYNELPTSGFENCIICGSLTKGYAFCRSCYKKHTEDELLDIINKDNILKEDWETKNNEPSKNNSKNKIDYTNCIICVKETTNGWKYLCKECYSDVLDYTKELNKNMTIPDYKDYYYNLKNNLYRMTGFENFIQPNCKKLIAIAKANDRYNFNSELLDKVANDVTEIINKKKNKDFIVEENKVIAHNEKVQKKEFRSQDGHFLDSQIEVAIDDILFQYDKTHAIHYPVVDIVERAVYCDWYLPITKTKGIYIELWGMDKKDYIDNKEEKINLYKKHRLKLIQFDKTALNDTLDLTRELLNQIKKLTNELKEED